MSLTGVGGFPVDEGQVLVLHEVGDVAHLVVHRHQVGVGDGCAHLDPAKARPEDHQSDRPKLVNMIGRKERKESHKNILILSIKFMSTQQGFSNICP